MEVEHAGESKEGARQVGARECRRGASGRRSRGGAQASEDRVRRGGTSSRQFARAVRRRKPWTQNRERPPKGRHRTCCVFGQCPASLGYECGGCSRALPEGCCQAIRPNCNVRSDNLAWRGILPHAGPYHPSPSAGLQTRGSLLTPILETPGGLPTALFVRCAQPSFRKCRWDPSRSSTLGGRVLSL